MNFRNLALSVGALLITTTPFTQAQDSMSSGEHHPVRVLLLTGGHPYDVPQFHAMFDSFEDMTITHREIANFDHAFGDIYGWEFDTVVMYNMTNELYEVDFAKIEKLTEWGVGFVPLHHGTLSWSNQEKFKQLFGVEFPQAGPFGFHIGENFTYHIEDKDHPITQGLTDFQVTDEPYTNYYGKGYPGNRVLVTTDHDPADDELVWVRQMNNSRIANVQGGHDRFMYANEGYREILERSILWSAGRLPLELGGEALADTTIYRSKFEQNSILEGIVEYDSGKSRRALTAAEDILLARGEMSERLLNGIVDVVLNNESPKVTRHWGLRQIGDYGSVQDLESISNLLGDQEVGQITRYAFQQNTNPEAVEMLISSLARLDGESKRGVARTLGRLQADGAIIPVSAMLGSNDIEDNIAAAQALSMIGGANAGELLQTEFNNATSDELRFAYAEALLAYAHLDSTSNSDALKIMTTLSEKVSDSQILAAAWRGRIIFQPTLEQFKAGINSSDARVRDAVIRTIPLIKDSALINFLKEDFSSLSETEKIGTLYALQERNNSDALPLIESIIQSSEGTVQENAIYVAGAFGNAGTAKILLSTLKEAEQKTQELVMDALSVIPDPSSNEVLSEYAASNKGDAKAVAITVLANRSAYEYADQILGFTADSDSDVKKAAYDAIGVLGSDQHIEKLIQLISDSDSSRDARSANRALISVLENSNDPEAALLLILQKVETADDNASGLLLDSIASLKSESAKKSLVNLLSHSKESIRLDSLRALSDWSDASPADAIFIVAKSDDLKASTLASRGYLKVINADPAMTSDMKVEKAFQLRPYLKDKQAKSQFLSIISSVPSYESLLSVQEFIDDPDVQREAVFAIINLSTPLSFEFPDEVKAALRSVIEEDNIPEETKSEARSGLELLEAYGERVVANWAFANSADGWEAQKHCDIEIVDGALVVKSTGEDPIIFHAVDIPEQPLILEFRLKYNDPIVFQFFLKTDRANMGEEGTMLTINPKPSKGDWVDYQIEFTPPGVLQEFRFDPAAKAGETIEIDYLRLLKPASE